MVAKTQEELDADIKARAAMVRKTIGSPLEELKKAAAEVDSHAAAQSLMDRIKDMSRRDAEDWEWLGDTLRKFVTQRRRDLDYLERLLGTGK